MFRMINITRLNPGTILRMLYTKMSVKESNMTQNNKKNNIWSISIGNINFNININFN